MKKSRQSVCTAFIMGALLLVLISCQKKEGPAERAGKDIDKATEKVGQKIEKAGDNIKDAAKGDKK